MKLKLKEIKYFFCTLYPCFGDAKRPVSTIIDFFHNLHIIIRGPDWSLGLVPNSQNGSLGLVPIYIIDVWD